MPELSVSWWTRDTRRASAFRRSAFALAIAGLLVAAALTIGIAVSAVAEAVR